MLEDNLVLYARTITAVKQLERSNIKSEFAKTQLFVAVYEDYEE